MSNPTDTRSFHIGDILSITTEVLVSPRHIDGVYDILQWMTGEPVWTHQLPRVAEECAPSLRQQFPDLAAVVVPDGLNSEEKVLSWLAGIVQQHGETRQVVPLPKEDHTSIDPLTEMRMNHPHVQVIPAVALDGLAGIGEAAARTAEALKRACEALRDGQEGSQA
ncbi:hypothetical protein [Nocardia abscessus]|uniref:DUF7736 domain-containing protein n=1 Tax=Nocardia abscessus TaxID=120957 RepID=UPI0024576037|nr:hypothetical protein [Nocardia abscessus]